MNDAAQEIGRTTVCVLILAARRHIRRTENESETDTLPFVDSPFQTCSLHAGEGFIGSSSTNERIVLLMANGVSSRLASNCSLRDILILNSSSYDFIITSHSP
jgi:hypothetical protein